MSASATHAPAKAASRARARLAQENSWQKDELGLSAKKTGLEKHDKEKLQRTIRVFARFGATRYFTDGFLFSRVFHENAPSREISCGAAKLFDVYAKRASYGMESIRRQVKARGGSVGMWLKAEGGEVAVSLGAFEMFKRARDGYKRVLERGLGIPDWRLVPMDVVDQIRARLAHMNNAEIARQFYLFAGVFLQNRTVDLAPFAAICPQRPLRESSAPPATRAVALGKLADAPVPSDKTLVTVKWTAGEVAAPVNYTVRIHVDRDVFLTDLERAIDACMADEGLDSVWQTALESNGRNVAFASSDVSLQFWKGVTIGCMRNSPGFPTKEKREFVLRKEVKTEIPVRVEVEGRIPNAGGDVPGKKRRRDSGAVSSFAAERVVRPSDVAHARRLPYILYDRLVECMEEAQSSAFPDYVAAKRPREVAFFNPSKGEVVTRPFRAHSYILRTLSTVSDDPHRHLSNMRAAPVDLWPLTKVFGTHAGRFFDVYECPKAYCEGGASTLALFF